MSLGLQRVLVVSSLCLFLFACGGGGGDGGTLPGGGDPGPGPGSPGQLNPGVAGALYFSDPSGNVRLDLPSGTQTVLRERDGGASASVDASEFVAVEDPASGSYYTADLVIYGADGQDIARFEVEGSLRGTPKFSRDAQYIAVHWSPEFSSEFNPGLAVFDRQGNLVRHYSEDTGLGGPYVTSWDWEPSGTLLFTFGDGVYRTAPLADPEPQTVATFPDNEPLALAVSPDGSRIAFTLGSPNLLDNHVFVMNADGTGQRQLTASSLNETSPAWSPDGSMIAVRRGVTSSGAPPSGVCPTVFLVPSDATNATLDEDNPWPAYMLQMIEDGRPRHVCAFSSMDWRAR